AGAPAPDPNVITAAPLPPPGPGPAQAPTDLAISRGQPGAPSVWSPSGAASTQAPVTPTAPPSPPVGAGANPNVYTPSATAGGHESQTRTPLRTPRQPVGTVERVVPPPAPSGPRVVATLPVPGLSDEAAPTDFLKAARGAVAAGRTGEARSSLEMAQTRL